MLNLLLCIRLCIFREKIYLDKVFTFEFYPSKLTWNLPMWILTSLFHTENNCHMVTILEAGMRKLGRLARSQMLFSGA